MLEIMHVFKNKIFIVNLILHCYKYHRLLRCNTQKKRFVGFFITAKTDLLQERYITIDDSFKDSDAKPLKGEETVTSSACQVAVCLHIKGQK